MMRRLKSQGLIHIFLFIFLFGVMTDGADAARKTRRKSSRARRPAKTSVKKSTRRPAPAPAAIGSLDAWVAAVQRGAETRDESWTVLVQDLATTQTIFSYQPDQRLNPASNRKMVTFGMAMELLGPDYRFKTNFGLGAEPSADRSHYFGDVILHSDGDPSLDSRFMVDQANPMDVMQAWARALPARGIAYVHGDLVIDATAFGADQNCYPEAWDPQHRLYSYAPVPSAVAIAQNLLRVGVRPASKSGLPGRVTLFPCDGGLELINRTRTVVGGSRGISVSFSGDPSELVIDGRVRSAGGEDIATVPLPRPLDYIGENLRLALDQAGVRLMGKVVMLTETGAEQPAPRIVRELGSHESPPLNQVLLTMMRQSDNFLAEQIWRATAAGIGGKGDLLGTRKIEQEWYRSHGLAWIEPGWDGSGLSRKDLSSAREMVGIARCMVQSNYREEMFNALPVAGQRGTLRHRSVGRGGYGRVSAKTGTMNGVSALTGFIHDREGTPRYVFSMIGNAPNWTNGALAHRIDQLVGVLIQQLDETAAVQVAESTPGP